MSLEHMKYRKYICIFEEKHELGMVTPCLQYQHLKHAAGELKI